MAHRVALLLVVALAAPLAAADYIVTRYDDPAPGSCLANDCSLREAVIAANANSNADRILLSAGTYEMQIAGTGEDNAGTGDLDLKQEVEILGPGATMTTVDANTLDRVFDAYTTGAPAAVRGITIRGGSLAGSGTALAVAGNADLIVEECEIRNNFGTGQAILVLSSGQITMRRSVATDNSTNILTLGSNATASFENVTIADNEAPELQVNGNGGHLICTHCTLKNASSVLLLNGFNGGTATFSNSIVSGTCGVINNGTLNSLGGNIESTGDACGFDAGIDQVDVPAIDLALLPLGDNGGPTRSILLDDVGSVALEWGEDSTCQNVGEDQRGADRPTTNCDSGATEAGATRPPTPIFHDGFLQGNPGAWSSTVGS